ncbi:MAG: hypothetical protein AB1673_10350 [Actinomycetota bacterium]|jgi:hypothetical protein
MTLWWIGNAVLLLVVAPVCVALLTGLLKQVTRLNRLADSTLEHGVALSGQLDGLPKLLRTQQLTTAARGLVGRYGAGVLSMVKSGS